MSDAHEAHEPPIATIAPNATRRVENPAKHYGDHVVHVPTTSRPTPLVSDMSYVLLAFKCCIDEDDLLINKLAVGMTRRARYARQASQPDDEAFRGRISHVEILIKQRRLDDHEHEGEGEWHRYSIMKKVGRRVGKKIVFLPGKVHSIKTGYVNGKMHVTNYRFYRLDIGVEGVNRALAFLDEQVRQNAGFNRLGYLFNFISPVLFGVSHYKQAERRAINRWFCTELIVCALQAGGMASFALRKACAISPNDLFDMIVTEGEGRLVFSGNYLENT